MRLLWIPLFLCLARPAAAQGTDTTYVTRAFHRLTARLGADTTLPADVRARITAESLDSLDSAQFGRLDDPAAVALMQVFSATLARLPEAACAAFIGRGTEASQAHFSEVFADLDPAVIDAWMAVFEQALRAEADTGVARREATDIETQAAIIGIIGRLELADRQRMMGAFGSQLPADQCWAARTMFSGIAQLPAGEAGPLVRAMFHQSPKDGKALPPPVPPD
jgi:hypothetical protein